MKIIKTYNENGLQTCPFNNNEPCLRERCQCFEQQARNDEKYEHGELVEKTHSEFDVCNRIGKTYIVYTCKNTEHFNKSTRLEWTGEECKRCKNQTKPDSCQNVISKVANCKKRNPKKFGGDCDENGVCKDFEPRRDDQ